VNHRWIIIFIVAVSFLWAQEIKPTPRKVPLCEIQDTMGIKHLGRILYVADSSVIFWQSNESYDSSKINDYTIVFPSSNISKINVYKKLNAKYYANRGCIGGLFGSVIGAIVGYYIVERWDATFAALGAWSGGLSGGVIGAVGSTITTAITSAFMKIDKRYFVKGKYEIYQAVILDIRKQSLFPFALPSELHSFLEK